MNIPLSNTVKIDNIKKEIIEIKKELLNLKIKKRTKQNVKSHLFRYKRRELAKLYTLITQIKQTNNS